MAYNDVCFKVISLLSAAVIVTKYAENKVYAPSFVKFVPWVKKMSIGFFMILTQVHDFSW